MSTRILIAGGGFGGFYAARTLERKLPAGTARITLVSDVNFLLYTPLLPGAAGGTLDPRHVVVPLREELERTELRLGTVTGADPERRLLMVDSIDGSVQELEYDQLVVALGSVSRTLPVPGLAEHGMGFKTLPEAIALRNRLIESLEIAEQLEDPIEREGHLTWVFVGAGYAGLEGIADLQDFASHVVKRYPRCRHAGMRFVLVEARDRVMPEIPAQLADFATAELRRRGIEIRLDTTVAEITRDTVSLSGGELIRSRHVCWTAGVKPHPVIHRLGLPIDERGRLAVERTLRVTGHDGVWAIGDAAGVPDPGRPGEPCPPTAQHAIRQGRLVARNLAASLGAGRVRPFRYRTRGVFVDMGHFEAVALTMGLRWRGLPAWFMARTYHLALMPGTKRKLRLMADWTVDLLFSRDASDLGQLGHPPGLEPSEKAPVGNGAAATPADRARIL